MIYDHLQKEGLDFEAMQLETETFDHAEADKELKELKHKLILE